MLVKSTKIVISSLVLAALVFGTGAGNAGGSRSGCGHDNSSATGTTKRLAEQSEIDALTSHTWRVLKVDSIAAGTNNSVHVGLRIVLEATDDPTVRQTFRFEPYHKYFHLYDQLIEGDQVKLKIDETSYAAAVERNPSRLRGGFLQPIRQQAPPK